MTDVRALIADLMLGFSDRRVPVLYQTEAAECGLACIGMVASFHGFRTDMARLRADFPISMKGSTFADLVQIADKLKLASRPVKLSIHDVPQLQLPCIVHWDLDHFVVLTKIFSGGVVVHDPAFGVRRLTRAEFSASFTGVALELWPNAGFQPKQQPRPMALIQLMGRVTGLFRALGQVLLLAAAIELFAVLSPFYIQWIVDDAIVAADRELVTTLAVGFGLLMLLQTAITGARSWLLMHMSTIVSIQWRANVFAHLMRLPVQYFQRRHLGDLISRFGSIDQIQSTITGGFIEAVMDGVMSAATLVLMFVYSKVLGALATFAVLVYAIVRLAWYGALRTATHSQIIYGAKQQSHFLESLRGVRTIKLFQREAQRQATWLSVLVDQTNAGLRTQKLQIIYSSVNALAVGIENIVVVWLGARMIIEGDLTVGALMAFKAYDNQFATRCMSLVDKIVQWKMLKLYGERLSDIVLSEPERVPPLGPSRSVSDIQANVTVSELRYRYSEHEPYVLDGVSFKVSAGETVAIVGASGCGKSTLINILLGILPPTSGDVEIGGVSLRSLGPDSIRSVVGTVMQDDVLFAGSLRDNISFFDPNMDWERVQVSARLAGVHEEIVAMPMGYNSLVGDMGTILSGGQKQRVLLARAVYKQPKLLILDEATSQLDVEKERQIGEAMRSLDVTRIIVAHRPETIAAADRIFSLNEGRIVEIARNMVPLPHAVLEKAPSFMRSFAPAVSR